MLLRALDTYQAERSERLSQAPDDETNSGSWRSLTIALVRAAADQQLHAKIAWARSAHQSIMAHLGTQYETDEISEAPGADVDAAQDDS